MKASLITSVILFLFPFVFYAQEFNSAPVEGVKKIVEWKSVEGEKAIVKGYIYLFQPDGKLMGYSSPDSTKQLKYKYHSDGRIKEKWEKRGWLEEHTFYAYKEKYHVEEMRWDRFIEKTFYYFNEKEQVIEKKMFTLETGLDEEYFLQKRTIYNYNDRDSLQGEMHYRYYTDTDLIHKKKTIHHYDKKTGKKSRIDYYNDDGRLGEWVEFEYDDKGRILKKVKSFWDISSKHTTLFLYKDDAIWKKTHQEGWTSPDVFIYKNGVPINKKVKGFFDTVVTNYQYLYHE